MSVKPTDLWGGHPVNRNMYTETSEVNNVTKNDQCSLT